MPDLTDAIPSFVELPLTVRWGDPELLGEWGFARLVVRAQERRLPDRNGRDLSWTNPSCRPGRWPVWCPPMASSGVLPFDLETICVPAVPAVFTPDAEERLEHYERTLRSAAASYLRQADVVAQARQGLAALRHAAVPDGSPADADASTTPPPSRVLLETVLRTRPGVFLTATEMQQAATDSGWTVTRDAIRKAADRAAAKAGFPVERRARGNESEYAWVEPPPAGTTGG